MTIETMPKPVVPSSVTPDDDPFYYGQRIVEVIDETGQQHYDYIPLTQDDFLDPEEGDHFVQGSWHYREVARLWSIFDHRYKDDVTTGVYSDLKFLWGIAGLKRPCPDVAIVPNLVNGEKDRDSFDVPAEGTRPCLVIELVSPRYRVKDVADKVAIYARAGVQEYIILDPHYDAEPAPDYTVQGYQLVDGQYVLLPLDERGWVYSTTIDVWVGMTEEGDDFVVVDGTTGARLLSADDRAELAAAAWEEAERRAAEEAERAAEAEQRAIAEAERAAEAERQMQAMQEEMVRLREEVARLRGQ